MGLGGAFYPLLPDPSFNQAFSSVNEQEGNANQAFDSAAALKKKKIEEDNAPAGCFKRN
jgi:hypothetical protein